MTFYNFLYPFFGKKNESQKLVAIVAVAQLIYSSTLVDEFINEECVLQINYIAFETYFVLYIRVKFNSLKLAGSMV